MTPRKIAARVAELVAAQDFDEAWRILEPAAPHALLSAEIAAALLDLLERHPHPPDAEPTLRGMLEAWDDDDAILCRVSECLLSPFDGRHTDDEIEEDDPPLAVIAAVRGLIARVAARGERGVSLGDLENLLGNACRYAGPERDGEAEEAFRAALAIDDRPSWRFNLGLLYKNRGRWSEGAELYRGLLEEGANEAVLWNLGICATGAGLGGLARDAWERAGFTVTVGTDGLPRMEGLGDVKVRLSTGTLRESSERDYEHVWAQPVSPCHGRIWSPTMYDHGYDIGDLVLWDGQPIGRWQHDGREGDRFAALGKLASGAWRTYFFRGRQAEAGQIQRISDALPNGSSVYTFDEQVAHVCGECIRTGGPHTAAHGRSREGVLVSGKIVQCPRTSLRELITALREANAMEPDVALASPELYVEAGDARETARQEKLFDELVT